ncbi:CHAP domain-containing protein [Sphingomonas sp. MMS24-JH45]
MRPVRPLRARRLGHPPLRRCMDLVGQAEGRYRRGHKPKVGSVIVFARSAQLRLGHVAVVSRIVRIASSC